MRIYSDFQTALNELRRDVKELGNKVHPQTMQDKYVADDPAYETLEYRNQIYTVTQPRLADLNPVQPWADAEFTERIHGVVEGTAWTLRPEVWQEFHDRGFGYTYGERYAISLDHLVTELHTHPDTRQAFLSVWTPERDAGRLGVTRVPCSLGYWFSLRNRVLDVTYLQRSADLATHLENDVYLSHKLQVWVADTINARVGTYVHWIGSLHVYAKDVADVF